MQTSLVAPVGASQVSLFLLLLFSGLPWGECGFLTSLRPALNSFTSSRALSSFKIVESSTVTLLVFPGSLNFVCTAWYCLLISWNPWMSSSSELYVWSIVFLLRIWLNHIGMAWTNCFSASSGEYETAFSIDTKIIFYLSYNPLYKKSWIFSPVPCVNLHIPGILVQNINSVDVLSL